MSSVVCDGDTCKLETSGSTGGQITHSNGSTDEKTIVIDVISDNVCPWCFVGKRRIESAIKKLDPERVKVQLNWLPYQLDPKAPDRGIDKKEHYLRKFGQRALAMTARLSEEGLKDGIKFHPLEGATTGNTFASHRLIEWSKQFGLDKQNELVEQLFHDYFELAGDLTNREHLADIATKAGLNRDEAKKFLDGTELSDKVREEIRQAYDKNVGGVPHFIFPNGMELSGAQHMDTFLHTFKQLGVYP